MFRSGMRETAEREVRIDAPPAVARRLVLQLYGQRVAWNYNFQSQHNPETEVVVELHRLDCLYEMADAILETEVFLARDLNVESLPLVMPLAQLYESRIILAEARRILREETSTVFEMCDVVFTLKPEKESPKRTHEESSSEAKRARQ